MPAQLVADFQLPGGHESSRTRSAGPPDEVIGCDVELVT